jgi:uncharacterized protein DUF2779
LPVCNPFDCIPFQWSVHIQQEVASQLEHYEFLAEDTSDPRPAFLKSPLKVLGNGGQIVAYNQSFESGVLGALANYLPEFKSAVKGLQERLRDT